MYVFVNAMVLCWAALKLIANFHSYVLGGALYESQMAVNILCSSKCEKYCVENPLVGLFFPRQKDRSVLWCEREGTCHCLIYSCSFETLFVFVFSYVIVGALKWARNEFI